MSTADTDQRTANRKTQDERIAAEPRPTPVEAHLARHRRRPIAVAGVVENGLVRPVDPNVKLPESARVIIMASQ